MSDDVHVEASEPLRALALAIEEAGSIRALATKIGLSEQYVGDVHARRRQPGPAIILALGLVKVVTYAPASAAQEAR